MKKWVVGHVALLVVLLVTVLTEWSCSKDGTFLDANPISPGAGFSAKTVASYDPFSGLDEDGHAAGVGNAEAYHAYLQIFARRLAQALNDPAARAVLRRADETNLAKAIESQPNVLTLMADGFLKDVGNASLGGKLIDIITLYDDGKAFLSTSEALFGLEVTLVDPDGAWDGTTPIPVFHNPVTDEKDTHIYDGFTPDGSPITMPFSMDGFEREDPFFYINQDEDFFDRPENRITALATKAPLRRPSLLPSFNPVFALFVKPVYADGNIPSCYHEESNYLVRFRFSDDHEGVGSPEMHIGVRMSFYKMPSPWGKIPGNRGGDGYHYKKADKINTNYPEEGEYYIEVYKHAGLECEYEVFSDEDSNYGREDELNVKVWEDDAYPNLDDPVGEWRYVPVPAATGNVDLTPSSPYKYGKTHDAQVRLHTNRQGMNLP